MTANLPYCPPINTDNDYHWAIFSYLFARDAMLVLRYMLDEEKSVFTL